MVKLYRLFYYTFQDLARLNILVDLLQLLDVVLLVEVVVDVLVHAAVINDQGAVVLQVTRGLAFIRLLLRATLTSGRLAPHLLILLDLVVQVELDVTDPVSEEVEGSLELQRLLLPFQADPGQEAIVVIVQVGLLLFLLLVYFGKQVIDPSRCKSVVG